MLMPLNLISNDLENETAPGLVISKIKKQKLSHVSKRGPQDCMVFGHTSKVSTNGAYATELDF